MNFPRLSSLAASDGRFGSSCSLPLESGSIWLSDFQYRTRRLVRADYGRAVRAGAGGAAAAVSGLSGSVGRGGHAGWRAWAVAVGLPAVLALTRLGRGLVGSGDRAPKGLAAVWGVVPGSIWTRSWLGARP